MITMSEYLELPDIEGTVVSKGDPRPEGYVRPNRTTPPLSPNRPLPQLTTAQKEVEVANDDVVAAREEKERKKKEKEPVAKRKATQEQDAGRRKKKKQQVEEVVLSSGDKTVDASPLNQLHPNAAAGGSKPTEGPIAENVDPAVEGVDNTAQRENDNLAGGSALQDGGEERHTERPPTPGISLILPLTLRF